MGYDMYLVKPPLTASEQAVQTGVREAINAALEARNTAGDQLRAVNLAAYVRWQRGLMDDLAGNHGLPDDHPLIVAQRKMLLLRDARDQDQGYFRLNIWGMGVCRDVMRARGMTFDGDAPEQPDLPEFAELIAKLQDTRPVDLSGGPTDPRFAATPDTAPATVADVDDLYELCAEIKQQAMITWPDVPDDIFVKAPAPIRADVRARVCADIAWTRDVETPYTDGTTGISVHKLCSNDGWWVTKEDCAAALAKHDAWVAQHGDALPEYRGRTIEWWPEWLAYLQRGAEGYGFTVR